jgi:hypothetical protein
LRFFPQCNILVIDGDWDDRLAGKRMQTLGRNKIARSLAADATGYSVGIST